MIIVTVLRATYTNGVKTRYINDIFFLQIGHVILAVSYHKMAK